MQTEQLPTTIVKKYLYFSYHCFTWKMAKNKFTKSIVEAGGEILQEQKEKGKYLVKVSNPNHNMKLHPGWQDSSKKYWQTPFTSFAPIQETGAFAE
jgi:hypothetical protein